MTWVVWRKFRTEAIICLVVLILLALILIPTGIYYRGLPKPMADAIISGTFEKPWFILPNVIAFLIGFFVGVPLISQEIEHGTLRLAVTQGLTRDQWLKKTFIRVVGFGIVFFGLLALLVNWWLAPVTAVLGKMTTIAAVGFAVIFNSLFLLLLGMALGALLRRIVPAMVVYIPIALLSFLVFGMALLVMPKQTIQWDYSGTDPREKLAILAISSIYQVDRQGKRVIYYELMQNCPPVMNFAAIAIEDRYDCLRSYGYIQTTEYYPSRVYWPLQVAISMVFTLLSVIIVWLTFRWINKLVL